MEEEVVADPQVHPVSTALSSSDTFQNQSISTGNPFSTDNPLSPSSISTNGFVTPLKKRRMARESLSLDSQPSSPDRAPAAIKSSPPDFFPPPDEAANHAVMSPIPIEPMGTSSLNAVDTAVSTGSRDRDGSHTSIKIEPDAIPLCTVNAFSSSTTVITITYHSVAL